jgi:hypothetical protein
MSKMMSVTDVKLTQKWSQLSGLKKKRFPIKIDRASGFGCVDPV